MLNLNLNSGNSLTKNILAILHFVVSLYAIYLSFKCNNGFNFGSFIVACCCPYIYILYAAAVNNFCLK